MVATIVIRTKGLAHLTNLQNSLKKMPDEMGEGTFQVAKYHEQNLKLAVRSKQLIWGGNLLNSIKARKVNNKYSVVEMENYAFALDNMRPHWVSLKKGRLIREWALTKGNPTIQRIARRQGSIRVHAHPFVDQATQKTMTKLNSILNRRIRNALTV